MTTDSPGEPVEEPQPQNAQRRPVEIDKLEKLADQIRAVTSSDTDIDPDLGANLDLLLDWYLPSIVDELRTARWREACRG